MKKLLLFVAGSCLAISSFSQTDTSQEYRNFPVIVTLQFHSLALPFHDIKSNFSNVGIGIGTEVSLNGNHNWAQQIGMLWYNNREVGDGLFFYTQSAWRPTLVSNVYTEVKIGIGYLMGFRPVESHQQINGNWESVGHKGKGMFTLPLGISIGYNKYSTRNYISPFLSYQFLMITGYNKSIPLVPETLIQVGSRIHLNYE